MSEAITADGYRSMDVTFNNVLEGTRQYFLGVPKPAQAEGSGQPVWPAGAPPPEEGTPAQSGAPAHSSRPPSAAAAPPSAPSTVMAVAVPPRPPSEPIEPEPHIIHKATVMREAAEKRRELPDVEDEEEPIGTLSPPSHIIRKPPRNLPSPAPAPAAPCPSPARPPSAAPLPPPPVNPPESQLEPASQYRPPAHRVPTPTARPPDHFAPGRPPDPYSASRPPESYMRYHYEANLQDSTGRNTHGPPIASPQPSMPARHSPQTYARISSSLPQHSASRLRETAVQSPPAQRYVLPTSQPPPPHNDRVPPIHHPQAVPPPQRLDVRSSQAYSPLQHRRDPSPYSRVASHYDRHSSVPTRKYDPQQAYPGYRPSPTTSQALQNHRIETHQPASYKHAAVDVMNAHYSTRPPDRAPTTAQLHPHDAARLPPRVDYPSMSRTVDGRSGYHYPTPSTSSSRYATNAQPGVQNTALPPRTAYRAAATPKTNYEYSTSSSVQTSPARSTVKPGYTNQQARMTVSVTSLVNQMNQTKQKRESPVSASTNTSTPQGGQPKKRESPLDLSVKTVKNSADSSTTQDDAIDSATMDNKMLPLPSRPASSSRQIVPPGGSYAASHKVDFAPNFSQYRERIVNHANMGAQSSHPVRYNGTYEARRPVPDQYPVESPQHTYPERNKYSVPVARVDYVPRIDLTRPVSDQCHDGRVRDDRAYVDDRKRAAGPIPSNIPEKIVRYETWSSDSRIEHNMNQLAREQNELISRPVYSYSSHKQFEAYQKEQKRPAVSNYHDHHSHVSHRFPYPPEIMHRDHRESSDYHSHYHDRNVPNNNRHHVIQKLSNHRDIHAHHHVDSHSGVPADKRVLSILRNSLETKQTGYVETARPPRQIPDLIVIDDVDDSVIEITDLTKDTDNDTKAKNASKPNPSHVVPSLGNHIQMPKAVDSIMRDSDYNKCDNNDIKSKSPENDVASRIRTKAELKVMPPSQDNNVRQASTSSDTEKIKLQPKSQKQHLFNQIRQDNLRLESVIKSEKTTEVTIPEVKSEPMNIDEIEKDAIIPIKTENILQEFEPDKSAEESVIEAPEEDLDWANACDSFMEQLKVGCHKKKPKRRRDTDREGEHNSDMYQTQTTIDSSTEKYNEEVIPNIVIKQEPMDEEESETLALAQSSVSLDSQDGDTTEKFELSLENEKNEDVTIKDKKEENAEDKIQEAIVKDKEQDTTAEKQKTKSTTEDNNLQVENTVKDKKQNYVMKDKKQDSTKDNKADILVKSKKHVKKHELSKAQEKEKASNSAVQDKSPNSSNIKNKTQNNATKEKTDTKTERTKNDKKLTEKDREKCIRRNKLKKSEKLESSSALSSISIKKEISDKEPIKIKEEAESTDDDEPLIKSKLLKEKERSEQLKYQLLKDLSEKSAYVKLECCDVDVNKNTRKSLDSSIKDKEDKQNKGKLTKPTVRSKGKPSSAENNKIENDEMSSDSDDELSVASRLRMRKTIKSEDGKSGTSIKTPIKASPSKKTENNNNNNASTSTPIRKPGFGDGSDFHPGWEEELYRYKRSLRMPTRLIAIPRGRSGGPFPRGSGAFFTRGSTSLPDLDPAPLSPAPSSAPSAATDDLYARRQDKLTLDSDLESNSSSSAVNRLHYDSEASTSTVFSSSTIKKKSSIVDVLIQKCGRKEDSKKKCKDKDDINKTPKIIPKNTNQNELLPTPSLGLVKNGNKGGLSAKKEKLMEDIFYLGAFRKETVTAFRNAFIKNTDGLIGATEEFAPVVLKSRTRTESRVLKQRATIKEVFGDERPASAPPTSCRQDEPQETEDDKVQEIKKEPDVKPKFKPKKIVKDKLKRRSSSIRDGLRSTKSLKRNDAKGRLLRLKKRNSLMKSLATKRMKDGSGNKHKKESSPNLESKDTKKDESTSPPNPDGSTKRRFKRLFGRRKFSSGFDYIRKKKKIIRREDTNNTNKVRRPAAKPSPESIQDIHKEIKSWFINKSIGETHLHRAARLGYTDCVAYCLEKMESDPCAKDNAGFTPLHVAAAKGHVRIARLLLQYGANVSAAAQGGIRPLHEACENAHVEVIRLLLSYGADPLLGTYAGQTPEELAEGPAARLIHLHISDVQGQAVEPWRFPHPAEIIDWEEIGCDPLASPPPGSPPPPPDSMIEIQTTDAPLPPFYTLRTAPGQPTDGLWCLLQDITNLLQIKSKESLLKQIHCGSGSPKELLREIRTQEFLERAQCHQLLCAGEKVNVRASKVALIRVTDKLRQLLKIETVLVS